MHGIVTAFLIGKEIYIMGYSKNEIGIWASLVPQSIGISPDFNDIGNSLLSKLQSSSESISSNYERSFKNYSDLINKLYASGDRVDIIQNNNLIRIVPCKHIKKGKDFVYIRDLEIVTNETSPFRIGYLVVKMFESCE